MLLTCNALLPAVAPRLVLHCLVSLHTSKTRAPSQEHEAQVSIKHLEQARAHVDFLSYLTWSEYAKTVHHRWHSSRWNRRARWDLHGFTSELGKWTRKARRDLENFTSELGKTVSPISTSERYISTVAYLGPVLGVDSSMK